MPTAVLDDVRTAPVAPLPAAARPRRMPVTVAAAGLLAVCESLGLLAIGLTSLDGVFGVGVRPSGALVAGTLLLLAGWVVLAAGGGASLVDGAGRHLLVALACGEIVVLVVLVVAGLLGADGVWLVAVGPLGALPVPALALLALAVPTGKLLLAGAPSAGEWVRAGGRPRTVRTAPVVRHRALRGVTVACIGLALTGTALLGAPADPATSPSTVAVTEAP
ncbi:hypothetical protein [uncultured Modestobacter sp.]|uniref:hypothetical protein n=1 Tax=uncultured Modestobacter sp. TaxID=380048 RepID=UPI002623D80D|nr:hypothetical protein [uncultured Modestobacter sp.]